MSISNITSSGIKLQSVSTEIDKMWFANSTSPEILQGYLLFKKWFTNYNNYNEKKQDVGTKFCNFEASIEMDLKEESMVIHKMEKKRKHYCGAIIFMRI